MRSVVVVLLVAGCAHTNAGAPDAPEAAMPAPAAEPVLPPSSVTPAPPPREPFTLTRSDVNRTLDASPGAFLRRVSTEARLRERRFAGWRIVAFLPGDAAFADGPLRLGDVILHVNGRTLERPDDLLDLWQSLRSAPSLTVELERDGVVSTLRWTIRD